MHMDSQENRRTQLRKWIELNGTPTKEKSYFSQLVGGSSSFGEKAARRLEKTYGMGEGWLDGTSEAGAPKPVHISAPADKLKKSHIPHMIEGLDVQSTTSMTGDKKSISNVTQAPTDRRRIPVISYVQAGMMTEVVDPFALGGGFEIIEAPIGCSERTFGLRIEGSSMEPKFHDGDVVIIDPSLAPRPGEFVVGKNGREEATFKKYRPRGVDENGDEVFELAPLNEDYPTLHSKRDGLVIIGVCVGRWEIFRTY
jgi:SOS-response transcriptional repressor LexA